MLNKYLPLIRLANHYLAMGLLFGMIAVPPCYAFLIWTEVVTLPVLQITLADGLTYNVLPSLGAAVVVLGLVITALIPGNNRTLLLERSHRDFHIGINDVSEAYYRAHTADRVGTFKLPSEFEGVRERFEFLKSHPDLSSFEPEILTLAAQMSYTTRSLASAFSDETVSRAQDFLQQRKYELDRGEKKIAVAQTLLFEVRHTANEIAMSEQVQDSQLRRIVDEISEQLLPLGFQVTSRPNTVVEFPSASPAE